MKVAMCQMDILYEEKEANLKKAAGFIAQAADEGAEMIFFPEMSFTGFSMNTALTAEEHQASVTRQAMAELAKKNHIAVGFGWVCAGEKESSLAQNFYSVVNEDGKFLAEYSKIHPFTYGGEREHFQAGDFLCVFSYRGHEIALSICYDLRFPELYQILSDKADILVTAANWPQERLEQWHILLRARAVENQAYMLGINCVGKQNEIVYAGGTAAYTPYGCYLAGEGMEAAAETICYADILEEAWEYRREFPVKQDRVSILTS